MKDQLKKFSVLLFVVLAAGISYIMPLQAQGNDTQLLQQIAENTKNILEKVNNLPTYLEDITVAATALIASDKSEATSTLQGNFAQLASALTQNDTSQTAALPTFTNVLLTDPMKNTRATAESLRNANDLTYGTLLGTPFFSGEDPRGKNANPAQNYIANTSGISLFHKFPATGLRGSVESQLMYKNYFNTVMAAESYNSYILSDMYANYQNSSLFNSMQKTLIEQASDSSSWFAKIASEDMGVVFRQILMFESQSYVLLSEMLKTQKELLYTQAMTNSLIIANGANDENQLYQRAQGSLP